MKAGRLAWVLAATLAAPGCGDELACGDGTELVGDQCEVTAPLNPRCGRGTVWAPDTETCELEAPPLTCPDDSGGEDTDEDGYLVCGC